MISKKINAKSSFTAYLSVKDNEGVNEGLIIPLVSEFFNKRGIINFSSLSEGVDISDEDFKSKNFEDFFKYFYDYIVIDINKVNNKIEIPVKYCITLDKENCLEKCEKTGVRYDEIILYNQPVFYFIYINIEDVFSFLRK